MNGDDTAKVTPARLRRDAYLYIRQSTLCCPSFGMSVLASLVVSADGIAKPRRRVLAGLWGSVCRRGAHSVVTSVTAARAEDSSAMALPAVNAASRAATAMLLTARG